MTGREKYKYWETLSDYDIETVAALIDAKRWIYVATICHLSVERLIKGMIVFHTGKEAPKSNNITFLLNRLSDSEAFAKSPLYPRFSAEKSLYLETVIDITYYHISDYPFSYQKFMDRFIDEKQSLAVYEGTKKLLEWLKSFQQ